MKDTSLKKPISMATLTLLGLSPSLAGFSPSHPLSIAILILIGAFLIRGYLAGTTIVMPMTSGLRHPLTYVFLFVPLAWLALVGVEFYSFGFNNFDTGIYANGVSNFIRSGKYYSSILGMPALGEHFTPNLLLFSPLLILKDSFLWFPLAKVIAFGACIPILFCLGREILGRGSPLIWTAPGLWVIHKYIFKLMAAEFQPSTLAMPFILGVFLLAIKGRWKLVYTFLLLLCGFKEHLPLVFISLGTFLCVENREKARGIGIIVSGIVIGILIYGVIMPAFANGIPNSHSHRFGPFDLTGAKFSLLLTCFFSFAFIPILPLRNLLWILPSFGLALITKDPLMVTTGFHYQDIPLTVMFVGLIYGLKYLRETQWQKERSKAAKFIFASLILIAVFLFHNRSPSQLILKNWPSNTQRNLISQIAAKQSEIPCLLYTSPSPRDRTRSRMPSSA